MRKKHKERLRKKPHEKHQNFFDEEKYKRQKRSKKDQKFTEEEKEKRCQYYQKLKQKLPEYRLNYYLTHEK